MKEFDIGSAPNYRFDSQYKGLCPKQNEKNVQGNLILLKDDILWK